MNKAIPTLVLVGMVLLGLAMKKDAVTSNLVRQKSPAAVAAEPKRPEAASHEHAPVAESQPGESVLPVTPVSLLPPQHDLLLSGLIGTGSAAEALFLVTTPNQPSRSFMLHVGEQNEWLKVLSIDSDNNTVKVVLKRPVVRIRNTGVEVMLSFVFHGATSRIQ